MFLPALTVALAIAPILDPQPARGLLDVLESDYVTTARSKGLSERRVLHRATRCATPSISTVAVLGVNIGFLVGGTLVIEKVFALPGLGALMINSIFQRDFPVVQGDDARLRAAGVLVYLLTDLAHAPLDPRVQARRDGDGRDRRRAGRDRRAAHGFRRALVPDADLRRRALDPRHDRRCSRCFAPALTPYDPIAAGPAQHAPAAPSSEHLLGTDHLGRDVWSRLALRRPDRPARSASSRC